MLYFLSHTYRHIKIFFFSDYAIKYISNFMTRSRLSFAAENMNSLMFIHLKISYISLPMI